MPGYASEEYARSLDEFGTPRRLERSGGWILDRAIPGRPDRDAMGCYPLFACKEWSALSADLNDLQDLVSLVLVADPFGDFDPAEIGSSFNRGITPFKAHHVVQLGPPAEALASQHHRRNARKALERVVVERLEDPSAFLDDWQRLYGILADRHGIGGLAAFSRTSFSRQLGVPGLVAFRAVARGETVGMLLWYVDGDVAYYHLGAYDQSGYALNASFALFWRAIDWFNATSEVRWLDLGAGAGLGADGTLSGLDRFKAGWSTGTRTAYLCRHVFRADRLDELVIATGTVGSAYFPAYRSGEFASSPLLASTT